MPRVCANKTELLDFKKEVLNRSDFQLNTICYREQNSWEFNKGAISHRSGGFFHIIGLTDSSAKENRIILYQPQSALTGLMLTKQDGKVLVCVQARDEPGNTGIVQFGPTIQSTAANFMKIHGGRDTDFLSYFHKYESSSRLLSFTMQTDLGELYYQKSKTHNYVEVFDLKETTTNTAWVELSTLLQCSTDDYCLNTDLRSLIALFDWEYFTTGLRQEDNVSSELLSYYFNMKGKSNDLLRPTALTQLKDWKMGNSDFFNLKGGLLFARLFSVKSSTREISGWAQPLLMTNGKGLVLLYRRVIGDLPEYLISVVLENGIDNGAILSPSICIYPGEDTKTSQKLGTVYRQFEHSEEGGRFYRFESMFEIRNVESSFQKEANQFWVSAAGLKKLFMSSNMISIQLRVISSAIVDELNPSLLC